MKKFVVLVGLIIVTAIVVAQSFKTQGDAVFSPVELVNPQGENIGARGLYVGELRLSNGVTCYVASNRSGLLSIETTDQFLGLDCVK